MMFKCKEGTHDFLPNPVAWFFPVLGKYKEILTLDLTESCWYDTKVFEGEDSWNKAGGIGRALAANNRDCALLAWRPAKESMRFEAAIYVNDSRGGWSTKGVVEFGVSDTACLLMEEQGGSMSIELFAAQTGSDGYSEITPRRAYLWNKIPNMLRRRGPWFGGRYPAPHDMEKWVVFKKWTSARSEQTLHYRLLAG